MGSIGLSGKGQVSDSAPIMVGDSGPITVSDPGAIPANDSVPITVGDSGAIPANDSGPILVGRFRREELFDCGSESSAGLGPDLTTTPAQLRCDIVLLSG